LKLRPNSDYAQIVREKISADKIELSKTAAFAPVTQTLQREFDKLAEENKQLRAEVEKWRAEAEQWRTHYASQPPASARQSTPPAAPPQTAPPTANPPTTYAPRPALRTHTVKSGDTLTSIAGRYGVKLDALTAVNPGLDPRKMRIGQTINVPAN
jgi:LysM repeat protein